MKNIKKRCLWVDLEDPLYISYHDNEWGKEVRDENKLFEFLTLEAFQAGLSWKTILHKRENFRQAFSNFDPKKVAKFNNRDKQRLLKNAGIIRNRLKIEATINNAKRFLEIQKEFGSFKKYQNQFLAKKRSKKKIKKLSDYPKFTGEAEVMSRDLKERGFKFLGPTVIYAHMQAVGMVNDHMDSCFKYKG